MKPCEVCHQILLLQGCKRFGPPDPRTREALCAITDVPYLQGLAERLLDAADWQDLLNGLTVAPAGTPGAAEPPTLPVAPTIDPPGLAVPGFEIVAELGRGGMGVVYQARQQGLNRLVALKMILAGAHAGAEHRERFRTEAEAVARLRHPNIVQVYAVGNQDGRPFLALEYVPGGSLERRLTGRPLPPREATALVATLAEAIHAAHQAGIVHRDLKPGNILLTADGTPKVADFGLAKQLDADAGQTRSGAILGTPRYMAPEQAAGRGREVGPATDVWALGVILYELLTGQVPFTGATAVDTLAAVLEQEPTPPRELQPGVPRDLDTLCRKCLHKPVAARYATAQALAEDLRRFLDGAPIRARRAPLRWAWHRLNKWVERRPLAALARGVLLIPSLTLLVAFLLASSITGSVFGLTLPLFLAAPILSNRKVLLASWLLAGMVGGVLGAVIAWGEIIAEPPHSVLVGMVVVGIGVLLIGPLIGVVLEHRRRWSWSFLLPPAAFAWDCLMTAATPPADRSKAITLYFIIGGVICYSCAASGLGFLARLTAAWLHRNPVDVLVGGVYGGLVGFLLAFSLIRDADLFGQVIFGAVCLAILVGFLVGGFTGERVGSTRIGP